MVYKFGDIPDDVRFKPYMPLYPNTWGIYQTFGWEKFHQFNLDSEKGCFEFFRTRFTESIQTSKDVISGNIDIPNKILSYIIIIPNVAIRSDLLQGIRNERTPQWANAQYHVINAYETFALNLLYEPSNYENACQGYDGWAAKEIYGLPDYAFALVPWPEMINLFLYQGRASFTSKLTGLTTEGHLYISPFEEENKELIIELHSHIYEWYETEKINKGVPYPTQTLNCEFPNLKNKKDPNNRFKYKYPAGEWIKSEDLGLSEEELSRGVFLKVTHETKVKEKIGSAHVISLGIGRKTDFMDMNY